MESTQTKVIMKEWANPTPAGLVALAIACFCFFALLTGKVGVSAMPLIGCWLIGGFVVQIVVGLLDLKEGNYAGGNTFLFFSAFFMLTGGIEMFFKYNAIQAEVPLNAHIDGYPWIVLTIVLFMWTPAFFKKVSLLSIVVLLIDVALPFIALVDIGLLPKSLSPIAGWSLLGAGLVAIYLSSALVVNTTYGKIVYPVLGQKRKS